MLEKLKFKRDNCNDYETIYKNFKIIVSESYVDYWTSKIIDIKTNETIKFYKYCETKKSAVKKTINFLNTIKKA